MGIEPEEREGSIIIQVKFLCLRDDGALPELVVELFVFHLDLLPVQVDLVVLFRITRGSEGLSL